MNQKKLIYFGDHQVITSHGTDGVALSFSFYMVDSALLGKPEWKSSTEYHALIVSMSNARRREWKISEEDFPKVLFEFGRRYLVELVENGSTLDENTLRMPMITTASHPANCCPFDTSLLQMPKGYKMEVEVQRRMGFK